jgi:hypothetical protein
MGFHRRHIDNEQVIEMFRTEGIEKVRDWYTKGVDALVTESGLASDISDLLDRKMDDIARWNIAAEMIAYESIKTM